MNINLPDSVKNIISALTLAGFKAYAVGGCIRDSILDRNINDWDITTSASPEKIKDIFSNYQVIETGIQHGTVTVIINKEQFEITTMRIDSDYSDNRHPDNVIFTDSISNDLKRRDFTINAIAYNDDDGIIDIFSGQEDLKNRLVKCVGDPDKRFNEDALRILRCLRFASVLNFKIESETASSLIKNRYLLKNIASERVREEIFKIICTPNAENILRDYAQVIFTVIPELSLLYEFPQNTPYHCFDVWEHTIRAVGFAENDRIIRFAVLLHDIGKPYKYYIDENNTAHFKKHADAGAELAFDVLNRLKLTKKDTQLICLLIKLHDIRPEDDEIQLKRLISRYSPDFIKKLICVMKADTLAHSDYGKSSKLLIYRKLYKMIDTAPYITLKDLAVNGNDIRKKGKQGEEIKKTLNFLLDMVLQNKVENKKEELLKLV